MGARFVGGYSQEMRSIHDAVNHALEALTEDEGRDLLIIPTGPAVLACRLLARGWRSNETKFNVATGSGYVSRPTPTDGQRSP